MRLIPAMLLATCVSMGLCSMSIEGGDDLGDAGGGGSSDSNTTEGIGEDQTGTDNGGDQAETKIDSVDDNDAADGSGAAGEDSQTAE